MAFSFIRAKGHYSGSGTFLFVMADGTIEILCAISDEAMDHADGKCCIRSAGRAEQFESLRPRIVERAKRKYFAAAFETSGPLIFINTRDMSN